MRSTATQDQNPMLRVKGVGAPGSASIHFSFDGQRVEALPGDTVGAALWATGRRSLRLSPTLKTPRGMFCAMGSCQECAVLIDGVVRTACNTAVRPGLEVFCLSDARTQDV